MAWYILFAALVLIVGMAMDVAGIVREWRRDRAATVATLKWVAVYILYGAIGIGLMITLMDGPAPPARALGGTLFLVSWILYGAVWLTRVVPRYRELPAWLARAPGVTDAVLLIAGAGGLAAYLL